MSKATVQYDLLNAKEAEKFRKAIMAESLYNALKQIDKDIIQQLEEVAPRHPVVEKYYQIVSRYGIKFEEDKEYVQSN